MALGVSQNSAKKILSVLGIYKIFNVLYRIYIWIEPDKDRLKEKKP